MAANIDAISCDFIINADHANKMQRGKTWVRDGINGAGAKKNALGPSPFSFNLIKFETTLADIHTWQQSIEALKYNKLVDAEDSDGDQYTDLLVQDVSTLRKRGMIEGGVKRYRGMLAITGVQA